ncbi:MAG: hypothetical protein JSV88_28735 [Candidatus Aminicenantes bacterium]|nr:MAG: hypothetical protein JSV88_28735 [Candidatus Aminicenantes bacterium]
MKKLLVFMFGLILSFCLVYSQVFIMQTTVCRPRDGEILYVDVTETYQIQWCQNKKMSGSIVIILKEEISPNVFQQVDTYTVTNNGIYQWQIPSNLDGKYKISIGTGESGIFEVRGGYYEFGKKFERFNEDFLWSPSSRLDPQCPGCGMLDISNLLNTVSPPAGKAVLLAIYRGGKLVTKLGNFGKRSRLPRTLKVRFSKEDYEALKQGGRVFELRVTNMKGDLLHSKRIAIKMKR